ncbi:MAG: low molecular weight protein arginine phosphatase [Elusimicrobiota bacterium]
MKLLFVCTGNSCRSVIAEYLLGKMAADRKLAGWEARSAGTAADPSFPTPEGVAVALGERGIEFETRRPQPVSAELMEWADIVLPMTNGHREHILNAHPEHKDKIRLFLEFAGGGPGNVEDPIGRPVSAYRQCRDVLEKGLERILEHHATKSH